MIERTSSCACGSTRFSSVQSPPLTTELPVVSPSSSLKRWLLVEREVRGGDGVPVMARAHVGARAFGEPCRACRVAQQRRRARRRSPRRRSATSACEPLIPWQASGVATAGAPAAIASSSLFLIPVPLSIGHAYTAAPHSHGRRSGTSAYDAAQRPHLGPGGAADDRQRRVGQLAPHERHDPLRQPGRGLRVRRRVERAGEHDPVALDAGRRGEARGVDAVGDRHHLQRRVQLRDLARVLVGDEHDALERPVGVAPPSAAPRAPAGGARPAPRPCARSASARTLRCQASSGAISAGRPPSAGASPASEPSVTCADVEAALRQQALGARAGMAPRADAPRPVRAARARRRAGPTSAPRAGSPNATSISSKPVGAGPVLVGTAQREHGQLGARGDAREQLVREPDASR